MKVELTETESKAIAVLAVRPETCASLGWRLWGEGGYRGSACSCPYARPAGRILASLRRKGLVRRNNAADDRFLYELTAQGRDRAKEAA